MSDYRTHLFVLCVLIGVLLSGAHNALQNTINDLRFSLFPREASGDVVLVAIDPPSIEKIGVWPWPRSLHAELLDKLTEAGASEVAFDVDFSSSSVPESDIGFAKALERAGGSVILPSFKQRVRQDDGEQKVFVNLPLPAFQKHSWQATVNVAADADGRVRRYAFGETLNGKFYPSVGALLAGKYETGERQFLIDFSIRPSSVPRISYADVLNGELKGLLEGKRVIVGGTAVELGDRFTVPRYGIIAGPVLQTLAAESILQGRTLHESSLLVTLLGLAVMMLAMAFLTRRLSAPKLGLAMAGTALVLEAAATGIQATWPVIVETAAWHIAVIIYLVAIGLQEINVRGLLARIAERRFKRIAMSLGDGLVCADKSGLITLWNPKASAIFGYTPDEILGKSIQTLWRVRDKEEEFDVLSEILDESNARGGRLLELEGLRRDGTKFTLEAGFSAWPGINGTNYGAVLRDITARKEEEEKIKYLAEHDTLTGLFNRHVLHLSLNEQIAQADSGQVQVAVLLLGIDHLKEVNDTVGHARGDEILHAFAEVLRTLAPAEKMVARLSGDEFAIILSGPDVAAEAETLATNIAGGLAQVPFAAEGGQRRMTCSIGIAIYPDDSRTVDALLANADLAMHRAKENGRNQYVFFHAELREELEVRRVLESDLRRAMHADEFELFYQPQVRLEDRRLVGAEALVRWHHPERGMVPPDEFIPVLNTMPLSEHFARWVMRTACRQGRAWHDQGFEIRIGVNLSPSQFQSGSLAEEVCDALLETRIPPHLLELEVTENILIEDEKAAKLAFDEIQDLGAGIAFDDFGTGYASLSYLKSFDLDRLKIDRSFVQDLHSDGGDAAIVRSTIVLSNELGLSVIAEGIEDAETIDILLEMGCTEGQGYFFGRPMPVNEFEQTILAGENSSVSVERGMQTQIPAA